MAQQAPQTNDTKNGRSRYRVASWVAGTQWALCVVLVALTFVFSLIESAESSTGVPAMVLTVYTVMTLSFSTVGAFIASRRPANPIGWIFCGTGSFFGLSFLSESYLSYLQNVRGDWTVTTQYVAWLLNQLVIPVFVLTIVLLMLLFPSGKLPTSLLFAESRVTARKWWQALVWMAVAGSTLVYLQQVLIGEPYDSGYDIANPLTVSGTVYILLALGGRVGSLVLVVALLFAGASLVSRLTHSSGNERQQLKWFIYALALLISGPLGMILLKVWGPGLLVISLGFGSFPIITGVAILRHRLYDIDVVINRTLIYGSLTAMLIAVYFGSVTVTHSLFQTLTDQQKPPQLAIVVSTLVIAALFNPLRRRIQSFIDRRFYRKKYDAGKTLEAFTAKLRDETDLDALSGDLVRVVRETMQRAHVSLWLRPDSPPRAREGSE